MGFLLLFFSDFLIHNNCRIVAVSIIISLSLFNRWTIVICSIDISLQMIVFLFSFLWGHSFCREVTLWFVAEKKNMALCSVYCLSCLRLSSAKLSHGVLFIFNFDIFYCLLYTLSLFTTNLDIEIWQWRAGLCKEFSAAGQSYLTVNTFDYCICWIFLWSFFFFLTPLQPLLTVSKRDATLSLRSISVRWSALRY